MTAQTQKPRYVTDLSRDEFQRFASIVVRLCNSGAKFGDAVNATRRQFGLSA